MSETQDSRDEEIFGSQDTPNETDENATTEATNLLSRLGTAMGIQDNRLTLGGRAFLRLDYFAQESGDPAKFPLSSQNLIDLYLDARPSERIRFYTRGRLRFDPTVEEGSTNDLGQVQSPTSVQLDQLWLKFDMWKRVFVTLGQQPIRWGSSRFWNPSDFLNEQIFNPLSIFDQRLGVTLLKFHIPIESLGWNFYAIGQLSGVDIPNDIGGAIRGEFVFGPLETALSFASKKGKPLQIGLDLSTGIWLFEFRLEGSLSYADTSPRYRGVLNPNELFTQLLLGELDPANPFANNEVSLENQWQARLSAGFDISFRVSDNDNLILGAEYFYNPTGYQSAEIYPLLLSTGAFRPLYLGQHYLAALALLSGVGPVDDLSILASFISNISDGSMLARLDLRFSALTYLQFNIYGNVHFGNRGEFRLGFDIPPVDALTNIDPELFDDVDPRLIGIARDGLSLTPPLFEVGMAVQLSF